MGTLTADMLRRRLSYDPETGVFTRLPILDKTGRGRRYGTGQVKAAASEEGYMRIKVCGSLYRAHRLAWLYMTGEWPNVIDHINGKRDDNRWKNLRSVDMTVNAHNRRAPSANSTSGYLGVSFEPDRNKWKAHITIERKKVNLGRFATRELAAQAYIEAKRAMHPSCTL